MRRVAILLVLVATIVALGSTAGESSAREQLVRDMTRALGLQEVLDNTRRQTEQAYSKQLDAILEPFRQGGLPPEGEPEVRKVLGDAVAKISASWDSAEATKIYANALARKMSDKDLRDAISFYTSPEGKVTYAAVSAAAAEMGAYVNQQVTEAFPVVMRDMATEIQEIARKYPPKAN